MVLLHFCLSRYKLIAFYHYIRKLLPSVFAEFHDLFLLRHVVRNHMSSKS